MEVAYTFGSVSRGFLLHWSFYFGSATSIFSKSTHESHFQEPAVKGLLVRLYEQEIPYASAVLRELFLWEFLRRIKNRNLAN